MKRFACLFLSGLLPIAALSAADDPRPPKLDPKRIINESNSFLKEREPEMNAEEYALYEKVVTLLETNSALAVRLLEGMGGEGAGPSPAFEFILGNAYYAAGQIDEAEARYQSAVKRYPTFLRAWNNLGVLYYTNDRFADAIRCFSRSVVLGDRDPTTFGLLGYSLEKSGNNVSAEMAYMQALGGDPDSADWKEGLLRICVQSRQFVRAESLVRDLIRTQPKETRFWLTYANILLSDNRKLKAMALLETAADRGVAGPDELVLLADLHAEQGLIPEALATYAKVFAASPPTGGKKLLHFAQMLIAGGKLSEAEAALAALSAPTPEGRIPYLQAKADLAAARKQWKAARAELESLLQLAPLDGLALLSLGRTYAAEEDLARATLAFEAACRIPASTYRASLELANIEIRNRHYARGVEYLEKALSLEKTDAVEDYLARIRTLVPKDS
jgi:tetratricopeptide (TPR) repeat protein